MPQVSIIAGPCAGGAAYSPALMDFIIMTKKNSNLFICGPQVIKAATGEEAALEMFATADAHATVSGNIHLVANDDRHALELAAKLLSYLPSNNMQEPPHDFSVPLEKTYDPELNEIVPETSKEALDVYKVINRIVDNGEFFEIQGSFARNIVVGFARFQGIDAGIIANQPAYKAGCLDIDASDKAARFIRFCDCFNIPLITLEDVPGFLPGCTQEHNGIIRHGAKIVYAYVEATVPKITLILRKAYGGAYIVMSSKQTGSDVNLSYPSAEIAVMGAEGAVNILYRNMNEEEKKKAIEEYRTNFANPYKAAELGYIDEIILPRQTRAKLIQALDMTHNKIRSNPPKKHGNMPL